MSESNDEIKGYELNEEEWELVDMFKNPDDLNKFEWQKEYPLKTKKDWDILKKELDKEWSEVWSKPPGRELQKSNINIELPEIKSQTKLIDIGISRVGLLIQEGYLIAKDLSKMSFDNLLNIHHNLTAQGVLDIFIKLSRQKIIKNQLVVDLKKALETLTLEWTGEYVVYKDNKDQPETKN